MIGIAQILKSNTKMDVAILKVEALTPFYSSFDTKGYVVGEKLYAAGFPITTTNRIIKSTNVTLTEGLLINTKKINKSWMLMSVPITYGNSGGPVLGKYGLIRGQSSGGYDVKELLEIDYGKEYVKKLTLTNLTMNIMISSIELKKWINETNIVNIDSAKRPMKLDSEEIGEIATRIVGRVFCYKYKKR